MRGREASRHPESSAYTVNRVEMQLATPRQPSAYADGEKECLFAFCVPAGGRLDA
jgi:hypothetical protein